MKHITLILIILICTSCGTTKEMRRSNRAAKKLERLVAKFPELARTDTILTKVSLKTPTITGTIIQPLMVPGTKEFITLPGEIIYLPEGVEPFSIPFNDNIIDAIFSYNGTDFALDYTIKPIPIDTTITTTNDKIQPVQYKKMPLTWWQTLWITSGRIAWLLLILIILIIAVRVWLKVQTVGVGIPNFKHTPPPPPSKK